MQEIFHFILIDDDPTSNFLHEKYIHRTIPGMSVSTFSDPVEGIDHITSFVNSQIKNNGILFLDINMPILSGWDVLNRLAVLPKESLGKLKIYMLSSSVNYQDKEKAADHPLVRGFIEKPLTRDRITAIMAGQEKNEP